MKLDKWRIVLETEPATRDQIGAIHGEFRRLEVDDRAERLAAVAALLGLDGLDSTSDLTMGQAGQLYRILLGVRERGELLAAAGIGDEDQADEDPADDRPTFVAELIKAMVLARAAPLISVAVSARVSEPDGRATPARRGAEGAA